MNIGPGLFITGPSRSGTSMLAGLFHAHGVFFGRTVEGDEDNRKGYFEHPELISRVESKVTAGWPEAWWKIMKSEGYIPGHWWGVKRGPRSWPWVRQLKPDLMVICKRSVSEVAGSRARSMKFNHGDPERIVRRARKRINAMAREAQCPVLTVNTSAVIRGDYQRLIRAFEKLGLWFDPEIADQWIDRTLWNGGEG